MCKEKDYKKSKPSNSCGSATLRAYMDPMLWQRLTNLIHVYSGRTEHGLLPSLTLKHQGSVQTTHTGQDHGEVR